MKKYKIAFVWQGISDEKVRERWNDGLWYAMNKISKTHQVDYFEPWQDIEGYDIILYWEAPVTAQGQNAPHYNKVRTNSTPKALLFAGGPIKKEWVSGFDMLFLESKINEKECGEIGVPWHHAFGVNNVAWRNNNKGRTQKKNYKYDGILHGTCASWKRQWLIGEAFGPRGIVVGKRQDSDAYPFNRCEELGATVLSESGVGTIKYLMLDTVALVNPCDYWGGGQRATLEAMAAGLPVVCCTDSPKNIEFVQESGFGKIVEPNAQAIKQAVEELKQSPMDYRIGERYVEEKWSGDIYASQIIEGIKKIIK
ncbi:glycosyltransferase [Candidatus Woesebacteria bacterium]|nr:glycosyltransferase [Candidatus Woesebacteria bacterium]